VIRKNYFGRRIPDPGIKKAPDPGSATLLSGVLLYCLRTILMGRRSLKQVSVLKSVSADTGNLDFFSRLIPVTVAFAPLQYYGTVLAFVHVFWFVTSF
jgi:hypothetical protein